MLADTLVSIITFLLLVGLCAAAYFIGKYTTAASPGKIQYIFLPKDFDELHAESFNTDPDEALTTEVNGERQTTSNAVAAFEQYQ